MPLVVGVMVGVGVTVEVGPGVGVMVGVFVAVGVGYWLRVSGKNMDWLASKAVAEIPSRDKMLRIANPILLQFRLGLLLFILYSLSSLKTLVMFGYTHTTTINMLLAYHIFRITERMRRDETLKGTQNL